VTGAVRGGPSLRLRVGLLTALVVGLAVAATSGAAYLTVRQQLQDQRDGALVTRARAAVSSPLGNPTDLVDVPSAALGAADVRIALVRADRQAFTAQGPVDAPPLGEPELRVARGAAALSLRTAVSAGTEYRVAAVPAGPGLALVLASSTQETRDTLSRLGLVLLLVGGAGVAVAAYAGAAVARTGLRPVRELTVAAEQVAATQRLEPIAVRGTDELARLTRSFNAMLAALAGSRDQQRALVADAGHELRTPLTSLRTNLDLLAQSEERGADSLAPAERAELLADVRAQVGELSDLVGDLVQLARDDVVTGGPAGSAGPAAEVVDLADVLDRAVTRVSRRAPGVRIEADSRSWLLPGDPTLLERAVTNLLDNAAKWSPRGGTVTATLRDGALAVRDEGPGIAAEDLPYVFDRFYRSQAARSMPGSGLGLAIVRHAVEAHGGRVAADRHPDGGTVVTARLPGRPGATG
jgi:two-component system sensor histidine kinase MprB